MTSLSTVSNILKKITSTATGCEAIGGLTVFLSSEIVKRSYKEDTGKFMALVGCPLGVLGGLAYNSIYNKFDDKITPVVAALTALSTVYLAYREYEGMSKSDKSNEDKVTTFIIGSAILTSFAAIAATAASEGLQYAAAYYNAR